MTYPERTPQETGLCEMALVWLLADHGIPRRRVLLMSQQQATAMLACVARDRVIDHLLRGKVGSHA